MIDAASRRDPARWPAYNARQSGRDVRDLCRTVTDLAGPGAGRTAVDLGCGAGIETAALLRAGWHVLALDSAPGTADLVRATVPAGHHDRLEVREASLADPGDLPASGLIYAGYALPHVPRPVFDAAWSRLRDALAPGGWLAVDLFGDRDSWAGSPEETSLSRAQVDALLDGLEVVSLVEVEEDGPAFSGPKHWHRFEVIARRGSRPS